MQIIKILAIIVVLVISNFLIIPIHDGALEDPYTGELKVIENPPVLKDDLSTIESRGTGVRGTLTQQEALGGSWLDSFDDDTGLIWTPDFINLNVSDSELKLKGRNIANSDFEDGSTGSIPTGWFQESYFAGNGTSEHDVKLANDRYFEGSKSVEVFAKSISDGMPMDWRYAVTNLTMSDYVNAMGATSLELYMSDITIDQSSAAWGYNGSIELVFDDGASESTHLLFRQAIPATENAHNNVSSENGADGNVWYKYKVTIPGNLDKTHLKIKLRFTAGCRYHINGWYASISANIDKVRFNVPETEFNSQPIDLPSGMEWDSLMIATSQPLDTNINITILNATDEVQIPGSPTYSASYQYDLSSVLDSLQFPSITLKGLLKTTGDESPILYSWGVSWRANNSWGDTFFSGMKVDSSTSVIVEDGVASFDNTGYLITKEISLPPAHYYDNLFINKTEPFDGTLKIIILDGKTGLPIINFDNVLESVIDLSGIDPHIHPSVKLKAVYETTGIEPGDLEGWAFNWTRNTGPVITTVNSASKVKVLNSEIIQVDVSDREDLISDLSVIIDYKSPIDLVWQTDYLSTPIFVSGKWNFTFAPLLDAETGMYSFKFECRDSFDFLYTYPFEHHIEVIHKILPEPEVTILPITPYTTDDLSVSIMNIDAIETQLGSSYELWYSWFMNNTYQAEFDNQTVIPNSATMKGEKWACDVLVWDGEDKGPSGNAKVTIQNTEPVLLETFNSLLMYEDQIVILKEKLSEIFSDADNDNLIYTSTGGSFIGTDITQDNGTVKLTPSANWFGTESITFTAADPDSSVNTTVHVTVEPTNDLPRISKVGDLDVIVAGLELEFNVNQDETLELNISTEDIDGDAKRGKLKVRTNITGRDDFYFDEINNKIVFSTKNIDVGWHYVLIEVTDNNETPVQYIPQLIKLQVVNVNDPPTVTIAEPQKGVTFKAGSSISFNCLVQDDDLKIQNASEWFIYRWFISSPDKKDLGQKQEISGISLEPGKYTISVEVTDSGNLKSVDTIEITVEDSKSSLAKSIAGMNLVLLLTLLIVIIVIIAMFLVLKKRKKKNADKPEVDTLTTEPGASVAASIKPTAQLPVLQSVAANPRAVAIAKQKLELLEAQYAQGTVDHLTYINMKEKYELEAKPVMMKKEIPMLPPARGAAAGQQPVAPTPPQPAPSTRVSPAPAQDQPVPKPSVQTGQPEPKPGSPQPKGPKIALPGQNNNKI